MVYRSGEMIIMINGAFGSGKTSTANMLHQRIPDSMIYDPEEIGYMLRNIITQDIKLEYERTGDFQDFELWKVLTVTVAKELKEKYNKHLIVPMTIYKTVNFTYILDGMRALDEQTHHFCLVASKETIHQRLVERGDTIGGWTFQQTEGCVEAFKRAEFAEQIDTEKKSVNEVVEYILSKVSA